MSTKQVTKQVTKQAVKRVTKRETKQAVKRETKQVTKQAVRLKKRMLAAVVLLLLIVTGQAKQAMAASVTITFSTDKEEVRVGDIVEVTMTLTSTDTMGDFEAYLVYDNAILEFFSAPACISGGGGMLRVSDIGASASRQERSYRIQFLALAQGNCELALYNRPIVYGFSDGVEMSVTGISKQITVLPPVDASGNSRLSTMKILDEAVQLVPLTPEFDPATETYFSVVSNHTHRLILSALPEDSRSVVVVSGEQNLNYGNNEVRITVTAENGSSTCYLIYVYREEKSENREDSDVGNSQEQGNGSNGMSEGKETSEGQKISDEPKNADGPENADGQESTDGPKNTDGQTDKMTEEKTVEAPEGQQTDAADGISREKAAQLEHRLEELKKNQEILLVLLALVSGLAVLFGGLLVWQIVRAYRRRRPPL